MTGRSYLRSLAIVSVVVALLATDWSAIASSPSPITFVVRLVSSTDGAAEPTLSYAASGRIYSSGMNESHGNLWSAADDTQGFSKEPDPPTAGGSDAIVHASGTKLFFAEIDLDIANPSNSSLQVGALEGGVWSQWDTIGDRPYFVTNSSGSTFLVYGTGDDGTNNNGRIEVRRHAGGSNWAVFDLNVTWPANNRDTIIVADRIYILAGNLTSSDTSFYVVHRKPPDTVWTKTSEFSRVAGANVGLPRVAVDNDGTIYAVYDDLVSGERVVYLRWYNAGGSPPAWSSPVRLNPPGTDAALPAAIAGASGRVGVGWYENKTLPGIEPSVWKYSYTLLANATASPDAVGRADVVLNITDGSLGVHHDFSFIAARQGSPSMVALAFGCNAALPPLGCGVNLWAKPAFAYQTSGPELS